MKTLLLFFAILFFQNLHAQIQTQSGNTYNGNTPEDESLTLPKDFADGWILDDKGNKRVLKIKFRINDQEILFTKDGNTYSAKGDLRKFAFVDAETGQSHIFKKIISPNKFVEVLNDSIKITLLTLYSESESENTDYADVKRKSKDLEKTYYISENDKVTKIKFTKKELIKQFPKLEIYFKEYKIDLKKMEDVNTMFTFLNK
jgi:hypothetical protein